MTRDILGLENGRVVLAPSNSRWHAAFEREATDLKFLVGARMCAIEHVGSTAISGIRAKPILDIMLGVLDLAEGVELAPELAEGNYEIVAGAGLPEEHVFSKGKPRTHLLHLVEYDGEVWHQKLAFRDALRQSRDLASAYENLKVELAKKFADDRAAYTDGKTAFVRDVVISRTGRTSFHTRNS